MILYMNESKRYKSWIKKGKDYYNEKGLKAKKS